MSPPGQVVKKSKLPPMVYIHKLYLILNLQNSISVNFFELTNYKN